MLLFSKGGSVWWWGSVVWFNASVHRGYGWLFFGFNLWFVCSSIFILPFYSSDSVISCHFYDSMRCVWLFFSFLRPQIFGGMYFMGTWPCHCCTWEVALLGDPFELPLLKMSLSSLIHPLDQVVYDIILLMEEILHQLGCLKPCKSWDKHG